MLLYLFMCCERAATPAEITAYVLSMKEKNGHCQTKGGRERKSSFFSWKKKE
jgi:hypothetical protein